MLPIDILIGILPTQHKEVPAFVADLNRSLSAVYSTVSTNIHSAHQHNKTKYDKESTSNHYSVGDIVWLYNPTIKTGQTKKLASLWRGPYTVVDRTNSVNYRIRLIGSPSNQKSLVVHQNRLKHCYGIPKLSHSTLTAPFTARSTPPLHSHVSTEMAAPPGGYTTSSNDGLASSSDVSTRPQRTRRPPSRYADFVTH